jgi:cell division initiation protein
MLTPLDIHNKEFRKTFRGYGEAEVDEFLDQVVRDFEFLIKENNEMRERLGEVEDKLARYVEMEETLRNALVVAQASAEEVRANSKKEAELIIKEAQQRADEILLEAQVKVREAHSEYQDMHHKGLLFKGRMRALLNTFMELLAEETSDLDDTKIIPA